MRYRDLISADILTYYRTCRRLDSDRNHEQYTTHHQHNSIDRKIDNTNNSCKGAHNLKAPSFRHQHNHRRQANSQIRPPVGEGITIRPEYCFFNTLNAACIESERNELGKIGDHSGKTKSIHIHIPFLYHKKAGQ